MARSKNFYFINNEDEKLFNEQKMLSKKWGLMQIPTPTPQLLFDVTGKDIWRRQKMYFTRAGLGNGRYLLEKNLTYRDNYITAINQLIDKMPKEIQDKWQELINRIHKLPLNEPIWNLLPPLKEWYPQNKLFKSGDLSETPSVARNDDVDMFSLMLYGNIEESLELNGV